MSQILLDSPVFKYSSWLLSQPCKCPRNSKILAFEFKENERRIVGLGVKAKRAHDSWCQGQVIGRRQRSDCQNNQAAQMKVIESRTAESQLMLRGMLPPPAFKADSEQCCCFQPTSGVLVFQPPLKRMRSDRGRSAIVTSPMKQNNASNPLVKEVGGIILLEKKILSCSKCEVFQVLYKIRFVHSSGLANLTRETSSLGS